MGGQREPVVFDFDSGVLGYLRRGGGFTPLGTDALVSVPFGASGTDHAPGLVPDPGSASGSTRYLCEDGTWTEPSGGGGGGGPSPSGSVVTETAFAQSSAAGSSATYSRGDHTHGTPAAPTASSVGAVPTTRTLTGTAPVTVDGDNAAHDLSANRTIAVATATTGAVGVVQLESPAGSDTSPSHVVTADDSRLSDKRTPTDASIKDILARARAQQLGLFWG